MSTSEVANKLVNYCRQGQYNEAQAELYHDNAQSIEIAGMPGERVQGMEAIKAKGKQWEEMVEEMHSSEVSDPIVAGDFFSISMKNDVSFKGRGRMMIEEICVYEVQEGKIVKEQFFYPLPPQGEDC